MKHTVKITALLIALFVISQVVGLVLLNKEATIKTDENTGKIIVNYEDTVIGPRPETKGAESLVYILIAIGIGTVLMMLLIKHKVTKLWKLWFFVAVWLTVSISFGVFLAPTIALIASFIVSLLKVWKKNPIIHNISEIFMYAGIALLLVPIFNLFWVSLLLIIISVYDFIAVNKSKHMVSMAQFQSKENLFAGLHIKYGIDKTDLKPLENNVQENENDRQHNISQSKQKKAKEATASIKSSAPLKTVGQKRQIIDNSTSETTTTKSAILGGGDIAFPMIFSGVVMNHLITVLGYSKFSSLILCFIITITSGSGLLWLFYKAEKEKFYPAMPPITVGCFLGLGIIYLIQFI